MKSYIEATLKEMKRKKEARKKAKAEDKEYNRILKEEEELEEKELKEEGGVLGIKSFINILKDNEEDEEINKIIDENEKESIMEIKKEEKRIAITIASVFSVVFVLLIVGSIFLTEKAKTDIEKITIPMMEEYYLNKYNKEIIIKNINHLTYLDDEHKTQESDIQIANINEKQHIVAVKNELLGDDIKNDTIYKEYHDYIIAINPNMQLIANNPIISYKDYYMNYNVFLPHIKALPNGLNFKELQNSNKLTISDIIMYQGEIDINALESFRDTLTDDSILFLLKNEVGLPHTLTVIEKGKTTILKIQDSRKFSKKITYYNLDATKNGVRGFEIKQIKASSVSNEDTNYKISNTYSITFETERGLKDEPEKTNYYLLSMENSLLRSTDIVMFGTKNYQNEYDQYTLENYPNIFFLEAGGNILLIGNTEIGIGNKTKKEDSILCSIGLC